MTDRIKQLKADIADRRAEIRNLREQINLSQQIIDEQHKQIHVLQNMIELDEDDERLSYCCGAPENDYGLCTRCGEHTEFVTAAELDEE